MLPSCSKLVQDWNATVSDGYLTRDYHDRDKVLVLFTLLNPLIIVLIEKRKYLRIKSNILALSLT